MEEPLVSFRGLIGAVLVASWFGASGPPAVATPTDTERVDVAAERFRLVATGALIDYYAAHPVRATRLGIHEHDTELPDLSSAGVRRRTTELHEWLEWLGTIERESLEGDLFFDHRILEYAIRAELLELEEVRGWTRNPMEYNKVLADGLASLIDRRFAPLETRLEAMITRLGQYPRVIGAATKNLESVPALWAEIGLRNTRGTLSYLTTDIPSALREQGLDDLDPALIKRWEKARRRGLKQLGAFVEWLENDLMPRANGDFRLGRDLLQRKLLYEEHVTVTVEALSVMNERAIEGYRLRVEEEARRIDPDRAPQEIVAEIVSNYPTPQQLIAQARADVEKARDLVVKRNLLTLPTDTLPIVRPTPEFERSGFASMSTPGPFEDVATEAYFNITNVDPSWSSERQEQHLTYFNYPGLLGISVHEAMPGHFVQLLYRRDYPTDLRKVFLGKTLIEGWAHYVEQMMVDEGLGDGDPVVRLGQLRRALQRHARWSAAMRLHAFEASVESTANAFSEIAFFAPFPALRETQRGTYEPTYLYYALGRMQILALRADYRAYVESRGETFSLREFHDRLLSLGLPLPMARQAMMPEWAPAQPPQQADHGSGPVPASRGVQETSIDESGSRE
jgi:uncharacterized protein (DUF885 family)